MILRKPYAFFIKYFKVIHLIMAIFMCLLIFQTNSFLLFFNKYINSNIITIGQNLVSEVFMNFTYIYIILVMVFDIIIWVLLEFKHKKRLFYIINFAGYVLVLVLYIYINSLLSAMGKEIVDIRLIMTIRDLVIISFSFQTLFTFITISRFLGFDIKKFNFEADLKELNINESDNEEFEVNLNVDVQQIKRKVSETSRNFKYYAKENLRIIIPLTLIMVIIVGFVFYKNITGYTNSFKQNAEISVPNYKLKVTNTYVTKNDYKMHSIDNDKTLVVLKINVKTTNNTEQFVVGKFALQIGKSKFYHTIKYSNYVSDIGDTYIKQKLSNEYQEFLLVYEIPSNLANKKKELVYTNQISTGIFSKSTITKISLNTLNLDNSPNEKVISLNENVSLDDKVSNINSFKLKTFEFSDIFKLYYSKKIAPNEYYKFYEPLQASFYGSYDKTLLKIDLELNSTNLDNINIAQYIKMFGKIDYTINNVSKTFYIEKQVNSQKVKASSYYFEVPEEIINAETISFIFNTRENKLVYRLK